MLTGGQSALVPTTHTRFPRASNVNDYEDFMRYVNSATNVLLTLNSAVNFLIYCLLGKKFRRIFVDMFCGCMPCYHRHRRPSSIDQSDIQLVTGKRSTVPSRAVPATSDRSKCLVFPSIRCLPVSVFVGGMRPSRAVTVAGDGTTTSVQASSRRWSLTAKNMPLLEVPGGNQEVNSRSAPSLLLIMSAQSQPCRIDVHV